MSKIMKPLALLIITILIGVYIYPSLDKPQYTEVSTVPQPEVSDPLPTCTNPDKLTYYKYSDHEWTTNNKFGLYIYAEDDRFFELAQNLVNSNGGEYGYVLIPYNVSDYHYDKWENVFSMLRRKRLIPIIQLWGIETDNYKEQTRKAADFLNTFLWPIRERYISVYNEPNDAAFWPASNKYKGKPDPGEYAKVLDFTIDTFKTMNADFFMINGALNVSAAEDATHMDSFLFMKRMHEVVPGIFDKLDGWASHPYPQPEFSGSPKARGRWSIAAYEDELKYLKELGTKKELPVFITETGWAHAEGASYNGKYYSSDVIADFLVDTFNDVWLPDDRVRAVTLFTVKYDPPFDHFSFVNKDYVPYKHYDAVKSMKKLRGNPKELIEEQVTICTTN